MFAQTVIRRHGKIVAAGLILAGLLVGCSSKKPAVEPDAEEPKGGTNSPSATTPSAAERYLKALAGPSEQGRRDAITYFAQHGADAATIGELLALLSDPGTAGTGKTHPGRIGSTREAAARALLALGEAGETALRQRGIAALRAGLRDRQAAVREHSAYTLGLLGPLAAPASNDLLEACHDSEAAVRKAALDALRQAGISNPLKYVALLNHSDGETARLAAELAPLTPRLPPEAVEPLTTALQSPETAVRTAAAALLARLGPDAASAVPALITAIRQTYPPQFDPSQPVLPAPAADLAYWQALAAIGQPAVTALAELLQHEHPLVRLLAANTLGEIGPEAAAAGDALKKALQDRFGDVAIEAAAALLRVGVAKEEARRLLQAAIEAPNAVALSAIATLPRLGKVGKDLVPIALAQLRSANPYARLAAVELVGTLPPDQARQYVSQLAELTTDAEPVIRQEVATVLQKLGPAAGAAASAVAKAWQQEGSEPLRDAWIDALLAMGTEAKAAIDPLLSAASDAQLPANRRLRIIVALPQANPAEPKTMQTLLACTEDKDADIRAAAAQALGQLRPLPPAAVQRLVAIAQKDNRLSPRRAALLGLLAAGPQARTAQTALQSLAERTPPDVLAFLAQAVHAAVQNQPARTRQLVQEALRSPKTDIRNAALEALLILSPTPAELPALQRLLAEPHAETTALAAQAVARLGPAAQPAVPALTALLNSGDPTVQRAALEALGQIGPAARSAAERIRRLTNEPGLGPAARQTLEKLGLPPPPRLASPR